VALRQGCGPRPETRDWLAAGPLPCPVRITRQPGNRHGYTGKKKPWEWLAKKPKKSDRKEAQEKAAVAEASQHYEGVASTPDKETGGTQERTEENADPGRKCTDKKGKKDNSEDGPRQLKLF
jgi:hypothetical protein